MSSYMHKTRASSSPGIAGWRARPSCASCARSATKIFCCAPHAELDLEDSGAVARFFSEQRPEFVFLAAAKVGGILANRDSPPSSSPDNLRIQTNVIECAHRARRQAAALSGLLLHLSQAGSAADLGGSAADRPAGADQPLLCRRQDRRHRDVLGLQPAVRDRYLAAMPTNLYGPGDNYDLANSHVLPALIRKVHEAISAASRRDRVGHRHAAARISLQRRYGRRLCISAEPSEDGFPAPDGNPEAAPLVNVGSGSDLTIAELARKVCAVLGFQGEIVFDATKPDGTPRKLMDSSKLFSFGWRPKVSLEEGIRIAYDEYRARAARPARSTHPGVAP